MDLTAHARFQTFGLVLGIGLLFLVFYRLAAGARLAPEAVVPGDNTGSTWLPRQFAPALAGLAVLLVVIGLARMDQPDPPMASCRAKPDFLPTSLRDWQSGAGQTGWVVDAQLQVRSVRASYGLGGRDVQAVVVEAGSATAKLPRVATLAGEPGQWREKQVQVRDLCSAGACVRLLQSTWTSARGSGQRHMVYAYQVGKFSTTSDLALRAFHGWGRLTGHPGRLRLVGLIYDGATPLPNDVLAPLFQTLQMAVAAQSC